LSGSSNNPTASTMAAPENSEKNYALQSDAAEIDTRLISAKKQLLKMFISRTLRSVVFFYAMASGGLA
jgi:hypothetical protein